MPAISLKSAALGLTAFAVTACGSQSSASDSANAATPANGAAASAAVLAQAAQTAPAAASQTALPIGQGLYIADYMGSCASADAAFFYDGGNYGYILQAKAGDRMNSARPASAEIYPIRRVGTPARGSRDYDANFVGFMRIWQAEEVGSEVRGVKAAGAGRFTWREGSASARQMEYDDTTYQQCAFTQMSPQMQAAVRQYRPQLASGTAPQASAGTQAPGRVAFPPIERGYWAEDISCAEVVRNYDDYAAGDAPLHYLADRSGSLSANFEVQRYEALGGNRYRLHGRWHNENGSEAGHQDITVASRTRFTSEGELGGQYEHCPTSQIPASIRRDYEG